MTTELADYILEFSTPCDPAQQTWLEAMDAGLRDKYGMMADQTSVGFLDLLRLRLAVVRPDRLDYGASVPKIGILLAYFQLQPDAARDLEPATRQELGRMIKQSSNALAAKFSQALGLRQIQQVLTGQAFYDPHLGGGIWAGKHYGLTGERLGDPRDDHSHAVTVRQVLRFYLRLEQGRLVSPDASKVMREIFASPDIPHKEDKFVKALAGRGAQPPAKPAGGRTGSTTAR